MIHKNAHTITCKHMYALILAFILKVFSQALVHVHIPLQTHSSTHTLSFFLFCHGGFILIMFSFTSQEWLMATKLLWNLNRHFGQMNLESFYWQQKMKRKGASSRPGLISTKCLGSQFLWVCFLEKRLVTLRRFQMIKYKH